VSPILTDRSFDIITHSPEQTHRIGERLGSLLKPGDVVCLEGNLGSGKTCLTQGIGAGMKVSGIITSPTFVYVNEHAPVDSGPWLYHVDLYRIRDHGDALAFGLEDYVYGDGVTVIEWAEYATEIMPDERLWVTLTYLDYTKRSLLFEAQGEHYMEIMLVLKNELYRRTKQQDAPAHPESSGA